MARLRVAVIPPAPPYGDRGPYEAVVSRHRYLHCWHCGEQLWAGTTKTGADIYACRSCPQIVDVRRIA